MDRLIAEESVTLDKGARRFLSVQRMCELVEIAPGTYIAKAARAPKSKFNHTDTPKWSHPMAYASQWVTRPTAMTTIRQTASLGTNKLVCVNIRSGAVHKSILPVWSAIYIIKSVRIRDPASLPRFNSKKT